LRRLKLGIMAAECNTLLDVTRLLGGDPVLDSKFLVAYLQSKLILKRMPPTCWIDRFDLLVRRRPTSDLQVFEYSAWVKK
jgi:hypothetical protein